MTRASSVESVLLRRAALRLGLQAGLLASVIVVLLSTTAVFVVLASQRQSATTLLDAAIASANDVVDPPAGVWLIVVTPTPPGNETAASAGLPAGLPDTGAIDRAAAGGVRESTEVSLGGVEYRIETLHRRDHTVVQAVLDLTPNHIERDQMLTTLIAIGGVGLLLAAAAGTWLGHRALRPFSVALAQQRRFVADAGHELRTPVTLLSTRAQLLRRQLRNRDPAGDHDAVLDEVDSAVEGIVADSTRLGDILEDLLIAADPLTAQDHHLVDLTDIARSVLTDMTPRAAERHLELAGPPPDTAPIPVSGSPVALRRAVTALVDNAIRHAHHQVTVTVQSRNGHALLDVTDDGPGVDPDLAPRLFERFVSGGTGPPGARRRYGLGLAVVSEIATAHGGRVELLDRAEPGAALRIQLPRRTTSRI